MSGVQAVLTVQEIDPKVEQNLCDGGWHVHQTQFYFAGNGSMVCAKHASIASSSIYGSTINHQPVLTYDFERNKNLKAVCVLYPDSPMFGLKTTARRNSSEYEKFLYQATEWAEGGLKFVGNCPICHGPMLDDGGDCSPSALSDTHMVSEIEGSDVQICYGCAQNSKVYERIMKLTCQNSS